MKTRSDANFYNLSGELTYNELYGGKPSHFISWTGVIELSPDSSIIGYIQDDSENSYPKLIVGNFVRGQGFIACLFDEMKNSLPSVLEAYCYDNQEGLMNGTIENHSSTKLGNLTNIECEPITLTDEQKQSFDWFVHDSKEKIEGYGNMTAISDLEMFSTWLTAKVKKYLAINYQKVNGVKEKEQ